MHFTVVVYRFIPRNYENTEQRPVLEAVFSFSENYGIFNLCLLSVSVFCILYTSLCCVRMIVSKVIGDDSKPSFSIIICTLLIIVSCMGVVSVYQNMSQRIPLLEAQLKIDDKQLHVYRSDNSGSIDRNALTTPEDIQKALSEIETEKSNDVQQVKELSNQTRYDFKVMIVFISIISIIALIIIGLFHNISVSISINKR